MVMERLFMKMERLMKVILWMEKDKGMEFTDIKMVIFMKESLSRISKMEKVNILILKKELMKEISLVV
jgi:hypothetical protein